MKWMILVIMAAVFATGCVPFPSASYSFSPYVKPDGTKGMQDSYGGLSESMANDALGASLGKAGLCPNGWYIEKTWPSPIYAPVTMREIKCK